MSVQTKNQPTPILAAKKKAIFLDRDGTIIVDKIYLNDPDAVEFLPHVIEGLRLFRDMGYCFIVVTNQSGVARGIVQPKNLDEIHREVSRQCARNGIDILSYHSAPYMTQLNHIMRKPNPGMLLEGAKRYNIDLAHSWMVGDRMTDVEAGHRAGTKTILIQNPQYKDDHFNEFNPPEITAVNLLDAAEQVKLFETDSNQLV